MRVAAGLAAACCAAARVAEASGGCYLKYGAGGQVAKPGVTALVKQQDGSCTALPDTDVQNAAGGASATSADTDACCAACSADTQCVAAVFAPTAACETTSGYQICRSIDYVGDGNADQFLDLYLPLPSAAAAPLPAVVFAQGSAFRGGSTNGVAAIYPCPQLTAAGIACAAMNYRGDAWPAQHQDMRAAVRWVRGAGRKGLHGLGGKIGVHGGSSGASLTGFTWAAGNVADEDIDPNFARIGPYKNESATVDAAAIYWPQYNPDPGEAPACPNAATWPSGPMSSEAKYSHSSMDVVKMMNPALNGYLDASDPPAYMVHGINDTQVSACNTYQVYQAAKSKGISVDVTYVPLGGHGCAMRGPVWLNGCTNCRGPDPDILKIMVPFFVKHLSPAGPAPPPSPPVPVPPTPLPAPGPPPQPPTPAPATPPPAPSQLSDSCKKAIDQACPTAHTAAECNGCMRNIPSPRGAGCPPPPDGIGECVAYCESRA